LRDLANACTDELDPYSRLLGRKPDARGTIEAAFLLPRELLAASDMSPLKAVSDQLAALFNGRALAPLMVPKLLEILGITLAPGTKLTAAICNQITTLLDKLDIAFEPDRRYGSSGLAHDGRVVVFKTPGGAVVDADKASYKSARTMIEVAALAASADGNVAAEEYKVVKAELRAFPDLSPIEHARLLAYAGLLLNDAPRQQAVLNKLTKLPEQDRRQIAQSAIGAVLADGHASPGEVKFLEKLYQALGYPVDDVYAALHRGAVVIDEPAVVAPEEPASGTPIPSAVSEPGIRIDAARLQRLRQETSTVSALLAGIFVEEEAPAPPPSPAAAAANTRAAFDGLDAAHGELLSAVLSAGPIDRGTFEERARSLRLLPDGAFETINEWSFENFDEPILEGDDLISVADHLRAELERLETTA
jgi:tellurite resistance protein